MKKKPVKTETRVSPSKVILKAFEEEHALLEGEKNALDQLYKEIRFEEKVLEEEANSVSGIRKIIEKLEQKEEFLAKQIEKKIAHPDEEDESYKEIKPNFDALSEGLETIRHIQTKLEEIKNQEVGEAVKTAEANWQVVDLLKHAIERAEKTKIAVERLFSDKLE